MVPFYPTAKIIADSISPSGKRLTTIECSMHRFVLAEFNTHRAFSRNSASSRAIPYHKMRAKALEHTAYPVSWPTEQKGMQGGEELPVLLADSARWEWREALYSTIRRTDKLNYLGVHKSVINRLLEPFIPHKAIVSATEWDSFFAQRLHPDAQPEIHDLAKAMHKAISDSKPVELSIDNWHVPYVDDHERIMDSFWINYFDKIQDAFLAVSVARCARVSYETHDGVRDIEKDFELFFRLRDHSPAHASPFEHQARPEMDHSPSLSRNFIGWEQYRGILGL